MNSFKFVAAAAIGLLVGCHGAAQAETLFSRARQQDPSIQLADFKTLQRLTFSRVQKAMERRYPGETPTIAIILMSGDSNVADNLHVCFAGKTQTTPASVYEIPLSSDDITVIANTTDFANYCGGSIKVTLMTDGHF